MKKIAVVYFSGYGHTEQVAKVVVTAAKTDKTEVEAIRIDEKGDITQAQWASLDVADAIVLGTPTYMGAPAWQFTKFADDTAGRWSTRAWQDKLFAGFTNSASQIGDKVTTMQILQTLAMQQGGIWVGLGILPSNGPDNTPNDINYAGAFSGLMVSTPSGVKPENILSTIKGIALTAEAFGKRIAATVLRFK